MNRTAAYALAAAAILLAAVIGYLSFGRNDPVSSNLVPRNPEAVATPDGSEVAPPTQP